MKLCIVVPCYNEEKRLDIQSFVDFSSVNKINFLFVDDGSSDCTMSLLNDMCSLCPDYIQSIQVEKNGGKAEAIRFGINYLQSEKTQYDFFGFYDSDQATPLSEIVKTQEFLSKRTDFSFLMGIRIKRLGSKVNRELKRHYLGRVFATFVSITLGLPTYDTQCGYKLIHKDLVEELFLEPFSSAWFFDVELLFRLKKARGKNFVLKHVYEYPLMAWEEVGGSKIGLKQYFVAPFELIKIRNRYS